MNDATVDIVIFCATKNEAVAARRAQAESFEHVKCAHANATLGQLQSYRCLTVAAGLGEERLERCFAAVVADYRPRLLVNFGAAGAVRPGIQIGTPTIPREIVSYSWPELEVDEESVLRFEVESLEKLSPYLELTRAGSCPHDIREESVRDVLHRKLQIESTDWESHRVATLCAQQEIPFVALRCITDHCGESAGMEYSRNSRNVLDRGAQLLGSLANQMLSK